jgi:hypothetical protein
MPKNNHRVFPKVTHKKGDIKFKRLSKILNTSFYSLQPKERKTFSADVLCRNHTDMKQDNKEHVTVDKILIS